MERLKQILQKKFGPFKQEITLETRISENLWLDDKIFILIKEVEQEFGVDFSEFDISKYNFDKTIPIFPLLKFVSEIVNEYSNKNKKHSITVGDFVNAIKMGKWIDPSTL